MGRGGVRGGEESERASEQASERGRKGEGEREGGAGGGHRAREARRERSSLEALSRTERATGWGAEEWVAGKSVAAHARTPQTPPAPRRATGWGD